MDCTLDKRYYKQVKMEIKAVTLAQNSNICCGIAKSLGLGRLQVK